MIISEKGAGQSGDNAKPASAGDQTTLGAFFVKTASAPAAGAAGGAAGSKDSPAESEGTGEEQTGEEDEDDMAAFMNKGKKSLIGSL